MAYACPVCDSLAPDGEHLAHHLAIVAMSRGGEHETWLDEHADGWRQESPETLATFATEHAEEVDHELADATAGERPDVGHHHGGGQHGHDHGAGGTHGHGGGGGGSGAGSHGPGGQHAASDEATAEVLAEAREITQRMLDEEGDGGDTNGSENGSQGGDSSDGKNGDADGNEGEGGENSSETDSDE